MCCLFQEPARRNQFFKHVNVQTRPVASVASGHQPRTWEKPHLQFWLLISVSGQIWILLYDPVFSSELTTSSVLLKLSMPGACIFHEFFWGSCFWDKFAVFRKMSYFRGGKKHFLPKARKKKKQCFGSIFTLVSVLIEKSLENWKSLKKNN